MYVVYYNKNPNNFSILVVKYAKISNKFCKITNSAILLMFIVGRFKFYQHKLPETLLCKPRLL